MTYKQRVRDEKEELDLRLNRLSEFISPSNKAYLALDEEDAYLLNEQFTAMCEYSDILSARIKRF